MLDSLKENRKLGFKNSFLTEFEKKNNIKKSQIKRKLTVAYLTIF